MSFPDTPSQLFALANLMSWLAWTPYILSLNGLGLWHYRYPNVLGTSQLLGVLPGAYLGPITAAFIVTAVADGRAGLRRWTRRLWHWRVRWHWYAVSLLGVPAVLILTGAVFSRGQLQAPSVLVLAVYVPALLLQMITTGLAGGRTTSPGTRRWVSRSPRQKGWPQAGTARVPRVSPAPVGLRR